jgi:hypothetical protein
MYRIIAVTASAAVLAGMTFVCASATSCDQRVAGSCPIEPIVEQADAAPEAATARPIANARAGKERSARRLRPAARHPSRAERRRTARAVAKELARERTPVRVAQSQEAETPAEPPVTAAAPAAAPALAPMFVPTTDWQAPKLDTAAMTAVAAPALSTTAPPTQAAGEAQSAEVEAKIDTTGQAAPEPRAPSEAAANAAGAQPRVEPAQAAMTAAPAPADAPWLRFAFVAFGGLLALGSAIRLFV